ncbi:MAG: hypothetical protein FD130_1821, partial [Halothiobacillaceae bacterium]
MSVAGVLVIDSDELRRQQIKAVLEFIDCEAIYWGDSSQCAALMETANQPQALLLGRCSSWDEVATLCRTV